VIYSVENRKYTLKSKLGYGVIDILGGGSFALISLLYLGFLVTTEGISPALAGGIVMFGRIWDAVLDPWLGIVSDRMNSKFGRRRVFFIAAFVPIILTFSLIWYSFGITDMTAKVIYYCIIYSLFTISYSLVQVPYNALLPDMVEGYGNRAGFVTVRLLISNISALISVTVPPLLLGAEDSRTHTDFLVMGVIFAFFYGLPVLIGFFSTWENPTKSNEGESVTLKEMLHTVGGTLKNKAYRQYLGIFCWGQMATDIVSAMAVFWLLDILRMQGMLMVFSGVTMAAGVLMLPVNNWMSKKYGKQYPSFICMPFRVIALALAFITGGSGGVIVLYVICILNGIGTSSASFVPWNLLPDVPDSDEMISGERKAGVFAGFSTFIRTFSSGLAIFLTGIVLQLFGYVESTAGETIVQTDLALFGVNFMFTIVPIALSLIVVWLGLRYTLTKKNHDAIITAIAHKRETGIPTDDPELIKACEWVSGYAFHDMWVGQAEEG
jgi:oligogalacturonide transporter